MLYTDGTCIQFCSRCIYPRHSAAGVACALSSSVASGVLLCCPLCMLYCNEATSVNCSEGWWLYRDDYYTLGSICTRLFFLLLLLLPIFFTPLLPNLRLATVHHRGGLEECCRLFFFLIGTYQSPFHPKPSYPGWLCSSLSVPLDFIYSVSCLPLLKRINCEEEWCISFPTFCAGIINL